jgi:hypothetical protein
VSYNRGLTDQFPSRRTSWERSNCVHLAVTNGTPPRLSCSAAPTVPDRVAAPSGGAGAQGRPPGERSTGRSYLQKLERRPSGTEFLAGRHRGFRRTGAARFAPPGDTLLPGLRARPMEWVWEVVWIGFAGAEVNDRGRPEASQWMMPIQNRMTATTTMTTIQPSTPMARGRLGLLFSRPSIGIKGRIGRYRHRNS